MHENPLFAIFSYMLTVYKASAGAGKTFRLAVEYIKHVIISPLRYESILAVTFTNKATEEMKMRIISQLYGLSHRLQSSSKYMEIIVKELHERNEEQPFTDEPITDEFVARRAEIALRNILHKYHSFRIETIDRFFQTVLRNLAHELELTPNLRVEIGEKDIVHETVDRWIDDLTDGNAELKWIMDYIRSNMDNDKKWNVIESIKSFGIVLLSDEYRSIKDGLNAALERIDFDDYVKRLRNIPKVSKEKINIGARELREMYGRKGYTETDFFQGGRGVGGFIEKMCDADIEGVKINSYVRAACDTCDVDADKWVGKKAPDALRKFCISELKPKFQEYMASLEKDLRNAKSAYITLRHISKLRMLHAIEAEMRRFNKEQNLFLLSDTQLLLSRMIGDSDAPFIFEKIGTQIKNIMIDEFQDTSTMQWRNFKVLLADRMSHNYDCMIVGDVKQSIYRWRSGDWRLLNDIESEFNSNVNVIPLSENYRSSKNIIRFNNAFYNRALSRTVDDLKEKGVECDGLKKAYESISQHYSDHNPDGGYVELVSYDKDDDYAGRTLAYVRDVIADLIETHGAEQKDIAVLVRNSKHIAAIVQYCMEAFAKSENERLRKVRFVSQEAFLLRTSPAVSIIVDALRYICCDHDKLTKARLSLNYQTHVLKNGKTHAQMLEEMLLPEQFIMSIDELVRLPLYQLCEKICVLFSLTDDEMQQSYLCCFFDHLQEYLQNNVAGVEEFIRFYDENMQKICIDSASDNSIQVMTIHKSKGLEFPYVIIPFCDWKHILEKGNLLWAEAKEVPFSQLPYVPLDYSAKAFSGTIYEDAYNEEYAQYIVDNMNLLYVATTRAKTRLYISTQTGQKENYRGNMINAVAEKVASDLGAFYENGVMKYGESERSTEYREQRTENSASKREQRASVIALCRAGAESAKPTENREQSKEGDKSMNVFDAPSVNLYPEVAISSREPVFLESNMSRQFTQSDDDEICGTDRYIRLGSLLHYAMSYIRTAEDIDDAVSRAEMEGLFDGEDITPDLLRENIIRCFANPHASEWFSSKWQLHNECTILSYNAQSGETVTLRPDRVMTDGDTTIVVDFKLYSLRPEYFSQVREYMSCLRKMGHKNVKGYLWMLLADRVEEVEA